LSEPFARALQVPCALGAPPVNGRLRTTADDFRVDEVLGFAPDGAGSHMLLTVEKRAANTGWVAAQLARHAGVAVREIGFSGHKDRHAVTRQAFTVPLASTVEPAACLDWQGEGYRVVAAERHARKLRPGSHRSNRFGIRVRGLLGDVAALDARLRSIATRGVPNYFGPQRFGRGGNNLQRALAWGDGGPGPRDRSQRGFVLSAARSYLFNTVLAARVVRGDWDQILPGEAVILDGRRSFFPATQVDSTLLARCQEMDVHPSGPLPGLGDSPATQDALQLEMDALAGHEVLLQLLARERLEHERRSLRLPVRDTTWQVDADELQFEFTLPRGTFATAVLHEVLGDAWDGTEGSDD
jgi:tRNA pseudouridine13 synthase